VEVRFDAAKDAINRAKHGISLSRAAELDVLAYIDDGRFSEPRFRLYGLIEGLAYCAAGTMRDGVIRIISLRRAHAKEVKRYV
jgi:uncharacterized protein